MLSNMWRMRLKSPLLTRLALRSLRFCLVDLFANKWLVYAFERLSLPDPVFLKRFAEPR